MQGLRRAESELERSDYEAYVHKAHGIVVNRLLRYPDHPHWYIDPDIERGWQMWQISAAVVRSNLSRS